MVDLSKYRDPRFSLPAVRVKSDHPDHEEGFFVINESDFDPDKHELWEEDQAQQSKSDPEPRPVTLDSIAEGKAHRKPHPINDQKLHLPMYDRKGQS